MKNEESSKIYLLFNEIVWEFIDAKMRF